MDATMKGGMDDHFTVFQWLGHSLSLAAIGGAIAGIFPYFVALAPFIYYVLEIYKHDVVQKWMQDRRLRALVKMRARTVALELNIRRHGGSDLRPLDEANQIHMAAASKAADITHEAAKEQDPSG